MQINSSSRHRPFTLANLFRESRIILKIGFPVLIAQLTQIGMNFVDTLMSGQYSAEALAAIAVTGSIWFPLTLFAVGCLLALPGMCAQSVGARDFSRTVHLLHQGCVLVCIMSAVLVMLLFGVANFMGAFGLDATLARLAHDYLLTLLPGIPAFLLFVANRSFLEGYGITRPAMLVSALALILNIPCNYALIYGRWGMPEMGAMGCGVATSLCFWFMAVSLALYARFFARTQLEGKIPPFVFDRGVTGALFRVGLPNAFAIFLESALYAMSALLLAPLGTVVVAGHQVTMSYAGVVFTMPLAIGMTITIRVGQYLGAGKLLHARAAAYAGLLLGLLCACIIMLTTVLFRQQIVAVYNSNASVVALACELMLLCAAYQVFDVIQNISCGILRGYNDTRIIFFVCIVAYGIVGLPVGYVLGRTDWLVPALGAAGFWWGYTFALLVSAVAFLLRVRHLHKLNLPFVRAKLGC